MKIRSGFVSNSSSSSFVIYREALSDKQLNKILHIEKTIEKLIKKDVLKGSPKNLTEKFSYYDQDPWRIEVSDDFVFGETSMDNFDISAFLTQIKVDRDCIKWDDGYNDKPYQNQLDFIKEMKQVYRKKKLDKINKNAENDN